MIREQPFPVGLEAITQLNGEIRPVVEAAKRIKVLEFEIGTPGDCFVFTAGVHGEETLGDEKIIDLLQEALEKDVTLLKGKIYLIPNLNAPGCENQTRHVFADEKDTHLNNVFDQYESGDLAEFLSLSSKTARYGWLIMSGLTNLRDGHRKQYGEESRMLHLDLHAEETAIPEIFIDRMDENLIILQRLLTHVRAIGLPFFLDYPSWREIGDNQILSAATAIHGFDSATIEEGKTRDPDIFVRRYIAWKLLEHLEQLGFVRIHDHAHQRNDDLFDYRYLTPGIKKSHELWSVQFQGETIYCLHDILPTLTDYYGQHISDKQLLIQTLESQNWDGILSLVYEPGLRGSRGINYAKIAKILYGSWSWRDYLMTQPPHNALIQIDNFPPDSWIISVAEPPVPDDRIVPYAFFLKQQEGGQRLKLDILDTEGKFRSFLTQDKLRELITSNSEIGIDLSILEVTCAVPDPKWKGEFQDGEFTLSPKPVSP